MSRLSQSFACVAACFFATASLGAEKAEKQPLDRDFLVQSSTCSNAAVQFSELAAKQATNQSVKDFAVRIIAEHKQCNDALAKIAKDSKIAIVVGTEKETRDEVARLSKMKGEDFDREYLKVMIDGHEKALRSFEAQAKNGKDEKLNTFASNKVSTLKDHLKEARELAAKIK